MSTDSSDVRASVIKALREEMVHLEEAAGGYQTEIERLNADASAGQPDVPALWRATIQREFCHRLAESLRNISADLRRE